MQHSYFKTQNTQLESAVNKFIALTEQFNKMAWHDPAHDETFHAIESLVEQHIENREFIRMVEGFQKYHGH